MPESLKHKLKSQKWQWRRSSPIFITTKEFMLALIVQHGATIFSKARHFRGRWKSFSPLGKQSGLRTDSFSAPSPTITPTPTTEDFSPLFTSSPTFSHLFLSPLQHRPPLKRKKKKSPAFSTHYHPISLYTGPCRPVSSVKHPQPPPLFSFCLLYCNHFAGPETCGCAGSGTKTRGREKEKLHGNWVKVEYLLEEAIWRRNVCTKRACSLLVIVLLLLLPWLYLSHSLSHFLHFPLCPRENIQLQPHACRAFHIITALYHFKDLLIKGKSTEIFYPKWFTSLLGGGAFSDCDMQSSHTSCLLLSLFTEQSGSFPNLFFPTHI